MADKYFKLFMRGDNMKFIGLILIVLLQVSCGDKDEKTRTVKTWALQEPVIEKVTGNKLNFSEAGNLNQIDLLDQIVFTDQNVADRLDIQIQSNCDGAKNSISGSLEKKYNFFELLPKSLMLNNKAEVEIFCNFYFDVKNQKGDLHKFSLKKINVKLNSLVKVNKIENLFLADQNISFDDLLSLNHQGLILNCNDKSFRFKNTKDNSTILNQNFFSKCVLMFSDIK